MEAVESLVKLNRQLTPEREIVLVIEEGFPKVLPADVGVELLRVLREALINVRRHSGASKVEVRLRMEGEEKLVAEVSDDGRGFDPALVRPGVGISAMRERVGALGGNIELKSAPAEGARVKVRVPLRGDTPNPQRL